MSGGAVSGGAVVGGAVVVGTVVSGAVITGAVAGAVVDGEVADVVGTVVVVAVATADFGEERVNANTDTAAMSRPEAVRPRRGALVIPRARPPGTV